MATAGPRPTIRWRTVRVDHPSGPCVLGDRALRRHSRVRARVGDRLAAAATGAPARPRLVKTLVSNSTFDPGSLSPTYIKPFDVLANGGKPGDWLARLDSN